MSGKSKNAVWQLLDELALKKGVTEVIINSPEKIFIEKEGQFMFLNTQIAKEEIYQFLDEVAAQNNKKINAQYPILDGSLPDGSRINAIIEPFAHHCPSITIRKYLKHITEFDKDPKIFGLNEAWVHMLKCMVSARCNLIVSGGTGVGKTTFMNLLMHEIPKTERVITIEDTKELQADISNLVSLETSGGNSIDQTILSLRHLVKNSLRMRPDRIIIGEVRGEEIFDLLQAMNTGHDGSFTSIHSNNTAECLSRMETLFMMAGFDMPIRAIREQIKTAVDFIIQLGRDRKGNRIIQKISEVTNMEQDVILLSEIAKHDGTCLKGTGITPSKLHRMAEAGLALDFFA